MAFPLVTAFLKDLIKRTLLEKAQANTTGDSANLGLVTKLLGVGEGEGKTKENKGSLTKAFANRMKDYVGEQINPAGMQFNQQNQTVAQPQEQFVGQSVMEYAPNQQPATIPQEYANMAQAGQPISQPTQDVNQTIGWGRGAIDALTSQPQPEGLYSPQPEGSPPLRQGRKTAYYVGGLIPNIIMSKLGQPSPAEATARQQQIQSGQQLMEMRKNSIDAGQPVIDPDTGQVLYTRPKGSVFQPIPIEEKAALEIKTASKKEANIRGNKLNELNKAINFFENKINELPGSTGLGGRLQGLGLATEGVLQTNPKAAAYMADVKGLRSQIARGLGEVGNLSEYEQRYAVALLPQITDNLETRQQKLQNFRDYIKMRLGGQGIQEQSQSVDPLGLR